MSQLLSCIITKFMVYILIFNN